MADDDQTPLDPEADPDEETEQPEAEETAEADDQPGSDPGAQEKDSLIAQLQQELALFRGQAAQGGDEEEDSGGAGADEYISRATQDSWQLAETIHGTEAMDAYRVAFRLYERAQTPADFVTAFEAYHQVRSGKLEAPAGGKAKAGKTREQAVQPRVDANRSDPGSDPDIDQKLSEARKQGSLGNFAAAAAAAMGFGPAKR